MLMAIKEPIMSTENGKGGLIASDKKKSAKYRLVNNGWSTNSFNTFLNINLPKHLKVITANVSHGLLRP